MESGIEVGNAVQTKAGGPQMTVAAISDEQAKCLWFDPISQALHTGHFPLSGLKSVK